MDQVETGCFAPTRSGAEQPESIRMVCWNVNRGGRLKEIVDYLDSTNSDLILLQETDRNARRTGCRNIARDIAEKLRMNYVFGCEFQELSQGSPASAAYHGQVTLSRWPLSNARTMRFESQSGFWRPRWYIPTMDVFQRRLGGRMALVTEVTVSQRKFVTYNLHLESRGDDALRWEQLDQVLQDTRSLGQHTPVLIAGDFNFDLRQPDVTAAISALQFENAFGEAHPYTAQGRFDRGLSIDFILTRSPLNSRDPKVVTSVDASDHFPLTLTLSLNRVTINKPFSQSFAMGS